MAEAALERPTGQEMDVEIATAELRLRIANQLNPPKIAEFLERFCPSPGSSRMAEEVVEDVDSFVRIIYAANYAEAREESFPYSVEWGDEVVAVGPYRFQSHRFTRRYPNG